MADGTKAVVDTSAADAAADEAALAAAIDEFADGKAAPADDSSSDDDSSSADDSSADVPSSDDPADVPSSDDPADIPSSDDPVGASVGEETSEITAPLSVNEIAAELAAGSASKPKPSAAQAAEPAGAARRQPTDPQPTVDPRDTATLPRTLPAPLRHSGDKIGHRYRLEECISQTETFSSWRAVDEKLRRAVGVHLMASGHQRARKVLAAAKSAALLGDPRFVQVLDAVQEGELVYVVREWLPHASDLAKLLVNGPMEPHEAYQMVRQVTDAVAAAHRRGQAHLRLTPRCVLRTDSGQYRINGIAVDAALRGLPDEDSADDAERADTRAIGVLLFAALTHRWPYPEDRYDLQGLPKGLQNAAPDQVRAGVHKGLSELAARALFDHPPHHAEPITTPEELAKAITLLPRIRQPEPELPAFTAPPRHNTHALPTAPNPTRAIADPATAPLPPSSRPTAVRRTRRRLRRVVKATAWTVALGAIGVASWQLVDNLRHSGPAIAAPQPSVSTAAPSAHAAAHTPVPIPAKAALSYNPKGGSEESKWALDKAIDGDPNTAWPTYGYDDQFAPGGYKEGTGLLIDLGSPQPVSSVTVQFVGTTTAELRIPNAQATENLQKAPLSDFTVVASKKPGNSVDYTLDNPVTTRYLLIWLTALPKDTDGKYRSGVAEVKVSG
ncbi:discoidin domain-containing protein [Kitasatospora aureofaciens]|uniref:protein kinase family protein n=1 Tax=Kitasatospora aureofaciens TaxID=1894 RepID=UPI001C438202|nr:protein kinase family protein [Kitasatospora aureofaciens]MBV6698774.1 discoidin domain-containing protein [Kitasatospora aureofaciens]